MRVQLSIFRRAMLATTFLVVPPATLFATPAMAQCAATAGSVAIPANGATVTCYSGLTSTTQIGDGTTSATVVLEDNHFLDRSAGGYGVHLNTATVTLGTGAVIEGGSVLGGTGVFTLGAGNVTLGTNAQVNGRYGIWSNGGNSVINLGQGAQINSSQQGIFSGSGDSIITLGDGAQINSSSQHGIYQNGNPVITLGAGAQINAGTVGIGNSFAAPNRKVTLTLGTGAQINAGTVGVSAKYADVTLQGGAQINAVNNGVSLGLAGAGSSLITLAPGSSIVSATSHAFLGSNNGAVVDTVDNAGLLQGVGNALNLQDGNDVLTLRTGSQIVGNVQAGAGNDTLNLFGTATEDANFLAFETFNMNGTDWTLSGNSVLGAASLNSGLLRNNGNMTANVTVNAGAAFGGTGNTTGTVSNSGTIAPGDGGIGTMTVTGGFTQGAGGRLAAEINPATSDLLDVTGAATLDGNLHISQSGAGAIADGTVYTVLQAGGGVAGTFSSVTDSLFFVNFTPTYNAGNVQLTAARSLAAAGRTSTEQRLAQAIDLAIAASDPGTAAVDALLNAVTTPAQASATLASQTGLVNPAAVHSGMASIGQLAQDVLTHASAQTSSGSPAPYSGAGEDVSSRFDSLSSDSFAALASIAPAAGGPDASDGPGHFWMRGTGGFGAVTGDTVAKGSDYYSGGLAVGIEYGTGNESRAGLYASASRTIANVDGTSDEATTDTYLLGVYGTWQPAARWDFKGVLSAGWMDAETSRPTVGGTAAADFSGYGAYAYLESAFRTFHAQNSSFGPVAGMEGAVLGHEGYSETGAGAFNLSVDGSTNAQFKSLLGAQLTASGQIPGHGNIGPLDVSGTFKTLWTHEFIDNHPDVSGFFSTAPTIAFSNPGPRVDRDALRVSGAVAASPAGSDYMEFYASYRLNASQDASDNRVSGGFRIRW